MSQPFDHLKVSTGEKPSSLEGISMAQAKLIAEVETLKAQVTRIESNPTCKIPEDSQDIAEFKELNTKVHALIMESIDALDVEGNRDFVESAKLIDHVVNLIKVIEQYRTAKVRTELVNHIDFPTNPKFYGY